MIEFMVVADDLMPAGHDWIQVEYRDGWTRVFLAASGGVVQHEKPLTINGVTFVAIDSGERFAWEWARVAMADGTEQIQWNRNSMAYRLGYALCEDDGTPVSTLRVS